MKRLVVALTAIAAFTAPALAADMAAKAPMRAAPVAYAPSWTGFWISGGFGYGMAQYQHSENNIAAPFALVSTGQDAGGKGWLAKVGVGGDYQFAGPYGNWVVGVFADADWSNISGQYSINTLGVPGAVIGASNITGSFRNDYSWAIGGRIGYVALPGLLTYFNGGYTQAHFEGSSFFNSNVPAAPLATGISLGSHTRSGYFLGGGTEYAVSQLPGLFWKNEVRFSDFGNKTHTLVCTSGVGCGVGNVLTQTSRVYEQKATTELVYRFNWGGPVVAKY
ncbi:MAG: porin family protein [Bradyrhizobium sp.]|uniref:outer membrane protein n=1 Tax=Bradyrhizobium sp. TaxID=376 RepID=UPI00271DBF90|nr:porin family protein [Bradyrhizobium sp.]MDO8401444.1 porin family protein [Bradyrhizobium sp.]